VRKFIGVEVQHYRRHLHMSPILQCPVHPVNSCTALWEHLPTGRFVLHLAKSRVMAYDSPTKFVLQVCASLLTPTDVVSCSFTYLKYTLEFDNLY
jgi:hypothetical protein